MCARYGIKESKEALSGEYDARFEEAYQPREYNTISSTAPVITADEPKKIQQMHFKLIPHTAKSLDQYAAYATFNAKSEEVINKPTYRPLILHHKTCLIPANGFVEWKASENKQPYLFELTDRDIFSFAGLWSKWMNPATGDPYYSYCILTTQANPMVAYVHEKQNRMPVILHKKDEKLWLSKDVPVNDLLKLCRPFPQEEMKMSKISKKVNEVKQQQGQLIFPQNSR